MDKLLCGFGMLPLVGSRSVQSGRHVQEDVVNAEPQPGLAVYMSVVSLLAADATHVFKNQ